MKVKLTKKPKELHLSLIQKWIISYASVLLMPIILCSFYYFHSYNILKERVLTNQHLVLQNFGEQVNSVIYDIVNLGNQLKTDKYVAVISGETHTPGSSPILDRHYLRDNLKILQVSNQLIDNIHIYFPEAGYVVNSSSSYKTELIPFLENKTSNLSLEDWSYIITDLEMASITAYSPQASESLFISLVLETDFSQKSTAVLCVQIKKKQLLSYLNDNILYQHPCAFALIDSDSILMSTENNISLLDNLSITAISDYYSNNEDATLFDTTSRDNDHSLIIDCFSTKIPGVKLISIAEKSVYMTDLTHLLEIMFITLGICLLTGLMVITIYSRRDYKPIQQIVHYIKDIDDNSEYEKNEYQFIMKMLTRNQNEIEYHRTLLRNNYLQKILTGEIAFGQITDSMAVQLQLNITNTPVCLVLLSTQGFHSLLSAEDSKNSSADSCQLLHFIIENIFSELLEPNFSDRYFIIQKSQIAVLINIPEEVSRPLPLIESLTKHLCEFLSTSYHLVLHAGISSIQTKHHIADAYLQAETALKYCNMFDNEQICSYNRIPQNPKINTIPLFTSEYVINLVSSGNLPQLTDYFRKIDQELNKNNLSYTDVKSCFYFFYQTTACLKLYCQTHYGLIPEALDFIDSSFFDQPLPEALSQTCVAFTHASAAIQDTQSQLSANRWGTDICTFIENNYFDVNINLNTIAEHFQVSSAYLSKKFKEQYQKSVIDYLYEVRILKAKKLMQETTLKVSEIAQITGFSDTNAFIRIFKKYVGTTPGRYISIQKTN